MQNLSSEADTLSEKLLLLHIRRTTQFSFRLRPSSKIIENAMRNLDRIVFLCAGLVVIGMVFLWQMKG